MSNPKPKLVFAVQFKVSEQHEAMFNDYIERNGLHSPRADVARIMFTMGLVGAIQAEKLDKKRLGNADFLTAVSAIVNGSSLATNVKGKK